MKIPSGQAINITVQLLDTFGNLMLNENLATLKVEFVPADKYTRRLSEILTDSGSGGKRNLQNNYNAISKKMAAIIKNNEVTCLYGTFELPQLIIQQTP
jgi:hypothetical protein